jgi:hypothetical protein
MKHWQSLWPIAVIAILTFGCGDPDGPDTAIQESDAPEQLPLPAMPLMVSAGHQVVVEPSIAESLLRKSDELAELPSARLILRLSALNIDAAAPFALEVRLTSVRAPIGTTAPVGVIGFFPLDEVWDKPRIFEFSISEPLEELTLAVPTLVPADIRVVIEAAPLRTTPAPPPGSIEILSVEIQE